MSFFNECVSFDSRTKEKLEECRKGVTLKLFEVVIRATPVDTGRARGSWQMSIGNERSYLSSNLPYMIPLEYGHSKQAPTGMVRINVQRIAAQVRANPTAFMGGV